MAYFIYAKCGAVRCGAVRCGAVRCGAVRCGYGRERNTTSLIPCDARTHALETKARRIEDKAINKQIKDFYLLTTVVTLVIL